MEPSYILSLLARLEYEITCVLSCAYFELVSLNVIQSTSIECHTDTLAIDSAFHVHKVLFVSR